MNPPLLGAATPVALRMPCEPASLRLASEWLLARCQERRLSQADTFRIDLCANELLQNLVSYACRGNRPSDFELRLEFQPGSALLTLVDSGSFFDPTSVPEPAVAPTTLEDAQIGGFGIALVRRFSDALEYRRDAGLNVVRVRFKIA